MHPTIFTSKGPLIFQPGLPPEWKGQVLPGAAPMHYIGDEGTAVIQQLKTKHFSLSFLSFFFAEATSLYAQTESKLQSFFSRKGSFTCRLPKAKPFTLNHGDFILCKPAPGQLKANLCTMAQGQLITTIYNHQLYRHWTDIFPRLKKLEKKVTQSLLFTNEPRLAPIRAKDAIKAHLYEKYRPQVQQAFARLRVEDALLNFLEESNLPLSHGLSGKQMEYTGRVYELVTTDIKTHHTIESLAQMAGTNDAELKKYFKLRYGIAIFELLQKLRFEKAKQLLDEGFSIKAVALDVGYSHTSSFAHEFHKYCGYTPAEYLGRPKG